MEQPEAGWKAGLQAGLLAPPPSILPTQKTEVASIAVLRRGRAEARRGLKAAPRMSSLAQPGAGFQPAFSGLAGAAGPFIRQAGPAVRGACLGIVLSCVATCHLFADEANSSIRS